MTDPSDNLHPLRRFRVTAVRLALAIVIAMAAAAYMLFDEDVTQGVLLGGIAGVLGFWIIAIRLEKLATITSDKVHFAALTWTSFRFLLYGVVLYRAYAIDREEMHGLLGAIAGILVIRFVMIFMGLTGMEMPQREPDPPGDSALDPTETDTIEDEIEKQ